MKNKDRRYLNVFCSITASTKETMKTESLWYARMYLVNNNISGTVIFIIFYNDKI